MHNALLFVQILQSLGHLCYNVTRKVLAKVGEPHDLVEKFAAWCEFQDNIIVLLRFGEVDKLDDVGVVELPHNLNFLEDICSL